MAVSTVQKRGFRKLPAKTHAIMFPLILSLLMSGIVSTIATLKAVGLEAGIIPKILQAWGVSYAVAFPTALLVMPVVRKIVGALVETPGR